ncbi:MAG TPA: Gmad2 immunoglobulin-like domain-containing protein [Candidatus Paceibacterota bacterium]|nr:Gmad2 immunoglobulin-like domain-containing protein [Candidatus Paceibacterota bacterium]
MKKLTIVLAVTIVILLAILIFVPTPKEPAGFSPASATTSTPASVVPQFAVSSDGHVEVFAPLPNAVISSPVVVQGQVTGGGWFFEATLPVQILDGDGTIIGRGPAQAGGGPGSWMSTGTVPFDDILTFAAPRYATGTVLLMNDNPSGDPANQKELRIPIRFK